MDSTIVNPFSTTGIPPLGTYTSPQTAHSTIPVSSVVTSAPAVQRTEQNIQKFDTAVQNVNTQPPGVVTPTATQQAAPNTSVPKAAGPGGANLTYTFPDGRVMTYKADGTFVNMAPAPGTGATANAATSGAAATATAPKTPAAPTTPGNTTAPGTTAPDLNNIQIDQQAQQTISNLQALKATMDATSNALINSITQKYAQRAEEVKVLNQQYLNGARNVGIVSGRARYAAELQNSILSGEESAGLKRLNDLEAEKFALIIQAQQAKNADDFKMLNAISDTYDKAQARQRDLLQKTFENSMQLERFGMEKADYQRKKASEDLKNLAMVDSKDISEEKLSSLEAEMGMPSGFATKYIEAARTAQQADNAEKSAKANKAYIELLKEIPAGQSMTMPDGSVMKGMGSSQDLYTFEKEDASGRVSVVSFNKVTGEMKTFNAGRIGTPSSTGGSGGEGTASERMASALAKFSTAFVPGSKLDDGTPILDTNNKITPLAWNEAIHDAPAYGLSRENFIKQFGYLLHNEKGNVSAAYGLTPTEQKLISGVLPE